MNSKFEDFSPACQQALDSFRKNFPDALLQNPVNQKVFQIETALIRWSNFVTELTKIAYCQGYLIGLGIPAEEANQASLFAFNNKFWISETNR